MTQPTPAQCKYCGKPLEPTPEDIDFAFARYGPTGMEDLVAATIERCAQVADSRSDPVGDQIAEAIRALKDK